MQDSLCKTRFDHTLILSLVRLGTILLFISNQIHAQPRGNAFASVPGDPGLVIPGEQCIVQDSRGFLWFSTMTGLYRYDGYQFKFYSVSPPPIGAPWMKTVEHVYEDRAGDLWVATAGGGIARLNRMTGRFQRYTHDPSDSTSLGNIYVNMFLESADGRFWIATQGGLEFLDRKTGVFTRIRHDPTSPKSQVPENASSILEDRSGILWFGSWGGGLYMYDPRLGQFRRYHHDPADPGSLSDDRVHSLCETRDGMLWVGTWGGGLDRLDRATGDFAHFRHDPRSPDGLSDNLITSLLQTSDGTLWVGTWNGGLCWSDQADGVFHTSRPGPFKDFGFSCASIITSLYEDGDGTLWIGGWAGIRSLDTRQRRIVYLVPPLDGQDSLRGGFVQDLLQDSQGRLWAGTLRGLACFDRREKTIKYRRHLPGDSTQPVDSWIYSMCEDSSGDIWAGSLWGLYNLGKDGTSLTHFQHNPADSSSLSDNEVYSLYVDRDGTLWAGTGAGVLNEFDRATGHFRKRRHDPEDPRSLNGALITTILEDKSDRLWIGTMGGGLDAYDRATGAFLHYVHDSADLSSISSDWIRTLHLDARGNIWARMYGGELDRFNEETGGFEHISRNAGDISKRYISGELVEDKRGDLWLATEAGIVCVDPVTRRERTYNLPDEGDRNSTENLLEMEPSGEGRLILPTFHGLVAVYPDSSRRDSRLSPVTITGFKVVDTEVNLDSALSEHHELQLPYSDNTISFDFALLDFIDPQRNQYAYMLEGIDRDWVQCGARQYARYAKLDPGEYIFRVKGSNSEGVWNEVGASIAITITPPWWKTRLAYALYGLVVLGTFYGSWRLQMKRVKIRHAYEMSKFEAAKLLEVDELKSRFFANISHEFRTPLTLILGPVKQLSETLEDTDARDTLGVVHKNAGRLLNLVNELLDLSKIESGNMKLQAAPQDIVAMLRNLSRSFCSFAERKRITQTFQGTTAEVTAYIDRDKIEKIFTNILSNAFKFTPEGGQVTVTVQLSAPPPVASSSERWGNGFIEIVVSDTGVGIPKEKLSLIFDRFYQVDGGHAREQEGTGIGLSLTRELVELHKGEIKVESEEGRGTTFTICLPLGKEHLRPEEICDVEKETMHSRSTERDIEARGTVQPLENMSGATGRPLVLIVEDNADVRGYIRSFLDSECTILEAGDGEEGWNSSIEQLPDIIVSDVMMPRLDGFHLCTRLKADERTSHIPVILLTAKAASQDKIEGFETGADDYIMKPFEPTELRARIENLLEQRRRLHDHFRKHGFFEIAKEKVTPVDQRFLEKVYATISERISDVTFGVEPLADCIAVSRSLLLKKLEALTGESPIALIRRIRLEKAARLIEGEFGNISEVALEVGFNNPSYFAECFKKQFGLSPKEYLHKGKADQKEHNL